MRYLCLLLLLTGCMVGPNYLPPSTEIPEIRPCDTPPPPIAWWEQFEDPLLNRYIFEAVTCNRELLAAEAAIFQARAARQMVSSQLLPQVNLDIFATRNFFSKNGPVFAINDMTDTPGLPFDLQIPRMQNIYTALFDFSWQIDLFGKIHREVEATTAFMESRIAARDGVMITLAAEVANSYIALRRAQALEALLEERICLFEQQKEILLQRKEKGLSNLLDLESIESDLAKAKSDLPPMVVQIHQQIYALAALTGRFPESLLPELCPIQPLPCLPCQITAGLRSDLLLRRPDIREAERRLAAATAAIGVAVASFFPSFALTGDVGLQSLQLSNFFEANSFTWAMGATSIVPIFQGGYLIGTLRLTEAAAQQAAFLYQNAVLQALKETESALIAYNEESARMILLQESLTNLDRYNEGVQLRYTKGLDSKLNSIESLKRVNLSKQDLLQSQGALLLDVVSLYKALGGGWELLYE